MSDVTGISVAIAPEGDTELVAYVDSTNHRLRVARRAGGSAGNCGSLSQWGCNCLDATPARSGERDAIPKMVKYVITQHNADATRVFAAGASSLSCRGRAVDERARRD